MLGLILDKWKDRASASGKDAARNGPVGTCLLRYRKGIGLLLHPTKAQIAGQGRFGQDVSMDEQYIREQIALIKKEVAAVEDRRSTLIALLDHYEDLLRQQGLVVQVVTPHPPRSVTPKGAISFRQAIIQSLRDEPGRELETHVIWHRARNLGAMSDAKDPGRVIDALCYSLKKEGYPIEKVGPMTWKWVDDRPNQSTDSLHVIQGDAAIISR